MADATMKNTFYFQTQGAPVPVGWTETWWSFHASLDAAQDAARKHILKRAALLGFGAQLFAWKGTINPAGFAPAAPKRITQVYFTTGLEGISPVYKEAGVGDQFDPAHEDLLCRVTAISAAGPPILKIHRSAFLSGLPDSQTDQLKAQGILAAFVNQPQFKQYRDSLINTPYYLRQKRPAVPGAFDCFAITDLQPIMVRHRNRGRPFFLFRGRRLA